MSSNKIINGTIILCVFYLVAKSLSFFVESLIATTFGASIETDAYYLADSVILALSPMLSVGIWKVFMPEYKRLSVKGLINETEILTGNLLVVFGAISLIASLLLFIFSNTVINIFAPGFDEIKTNYASYILKILSPILLLGTAATFPSAILQAQSNFSKSQFKEIVVFFVPFLYLVFALNRGISNINGLAISLLIGYILAMLLQFYFLRSSAKLRVGRKIFSKDVVSLLKLYPVACLNSAILQLNSVIDKVFCSTLAVGAITFLNYGTKVINLFNGIFSTTVSVAVFPHIAELSAKDNKDSLNSFLHNYFSVLLCILVPFSLYLTYFSEDIISLLFGHGKFDSNSVLETSIILRTYAIGLIAMGFTTAFNDILYIYKRVRYILYTTLLNISCNIAFDFLFIESLGVQGLCLATTLSLYLTLLYKYYYVRNIIDVRKSLLMNIYAIALSSAVAFLLMYVISICVTIQPIILRLCISLIVISTVYIILICIINSYYRNIFITHLIKRLKK